MTKLCESTNDSSTCETNLTISGIGGFGKTTLVVSMCYHPKIKEMFSDGFLFVELGPQATDPYIKLRALYNLLTEKQCDINVVEKCIRQHTAAYCHNLLVIIDDVWHVEDAEPIVKAFNNCTMILTTRMSDINLYIPTKDTVTVGPMEQTEAMSLLTCKIIDCNQLSQTDKGLLEELAQDIHLWPLLLSLVRGQLSHNLKQCHSSYHEAIHNVHTKLHNRGLTAFDKNNIENVNRSRNYAVQVCIEVTLELLTKILSNKLKSLILWTGIGTLLPAAVLSNLWSVSAEEARHSIDVLWAYGLVQYADIKIALNNSVQHCVEVHAVISQYIIESMESQQVINLSPFGGLNTWLSVGEGLTLAFQQSYGVNDLSSLTAVDYLNYKLSEIENDLLPSYLKTINMYAINDPHRIILALEKLQKFLRSSLQNVTLLSFLTEEIKSLIGVGQSALKDAYRLSRKFNQAFQRYLGEKNFEMLIKVVEDYSRNNPIGSVTEDAVMLMHKIIPHYQGDLLYYVTLKCEEFQIKRPDYHQVTIVILPYIRFYVNLHKQICDSLLSGSPNAEWLHRYILSRDFLEDHNSIDTNRLIKLQEVAPNFVYQQVFSQ